MILKTKVFENYRKFDENDKYKTYAVCDFCEKPSEQYLLLEGWLYICKGCLSKGIEKLDKTFIEHCKTDKRKNEVK